MKYFFILFLLVSFSVSSEEITTDIIKVYDGVSVRFIYNQENVPGRLQGIDAPEIGQEHGIKSRDYLRKLILNKEVNIIIHGQDMCQ